jgi:hypothetical protein
VFTLRFDMRAPALGAPTSALYAAAIQMCAWAEGRACLAAILCEHHGSEDGYLPAPLILASAIAARTERLARSLAVIIPIYDPVRLAEEMVLDRELTNWETYRSGKGTVLDIILTGVEVPPGVILFEDPPLHDRHRRLLSPVFTQRRMEAIEPLVRQFCARVLDP